VEWATLSLRYTYADTGRKDGSRLIRVPARDLAWSAVIRPTSRLRLHVSGQRVSGTLDTNFGIFPSTDVRLEDFEVVNLTLSLSISDHTELYTRVDNLLDEEYQTVLGFGTSDRAAYVGYRTNF